MRRIIRQYTPFIILAYSLVFAVCSYYSFYFDWYKYLPDLLGYSVFTNIFMISVYWNTKYCKSTKICVFGLILLNLLNILYKMIDINGVLYDIYLILIIGVVLILKRM